jgi:hypothetical protein
MLNMRRIKFGRNNRSGNLLHIEIPGAIVNIRINLHDNQGREVTRVDILPDNEHRGGDEHGRMWDVDSNSDGTVTRLIRRHRDCA